MTVGTGVLIIMIYICVYSIVSRICSTVETVSINKVIAELTSQGKEVKDILKKQSCLFHS